jgi:hypothetical protein
MMHTNDQTVVVRHKEFLCEVTSSTTFNIVRSFTINPGSSTTFPWLSRIANSYQQYKLRGLVFHYLPSSGSATGSNTALGTVMMQTSYRSSDTAPTTKVEMLNEYWSSESVPSETFAHPLECNPAENPFNVQYIRGTDVPVPAGDSPLLYDLGTTHLAVSGQQASGVVLGDLWVTYEVELKKPIISSNVTSSTFLYTTYANTSPTFASPFATTSTSAGNIVLGLSGRAITFPAAAFGEFWIIIRYLPAVTFTNASTAGAVSVTNATRVAFSPTLDRIEDTVAAAGTINGVTYGIRIVKFQRELAAVVTLPLASASSGTLSQVDLTVTGTPQDAY